MPTLEGLPQYLQYPYPLLHGPIRMHRRSLPSLYDPSSPVISLQQKQMAIVGSHLRRFVLLDNLHCADTATSMLLELFGSDCKMPTEIEFGRFCLADPYN